MGEEAPQLRGVLDPVGAAERVVEHDVIDLVGTALEWHEATAASDEGVDGREIDAPLLKGGENGLLAVGHLLGDALELGKPGGVVTDGPGEGLTVPFEDADLGGG